MWNMSAFLGVPCMSSVWQELGSLWIIVPMQGNTDLNGAGNAAALVLDFLNIPEEINLV